MEKIALILAKNAPIIVIYGWNFSFNDTHMEKLVLLLNSVQKLIEINIEINSDVFRMFTQSIKFF